MGYAGCVSPIHTYACCQFVQLALLNSSDPFSPFNSLFLLLIGYSSFAPAIAGFNCSLRPLNARFSCFFHFFVLPLQ